MSVKNAVSKANAIIGMVNPKYDLTFENIMDIYKAYGGNFETISCSFRLGYLRGMKAAKANMKKGGKVNG